MRDRNHEVLAGILDQAFDIALVIAFARPAEPVGEQEVANQLAEGATAHADAIAQNARHGDLEIIIEDRERHGAEEGEGCNVAVEKRLGRLGRIGLHEAGIRVRQVHAEEMDLLAHPGDHCDRFAKIDLGVARRVDQRHEHLARRDAGPAYIVLHRGVPTRISVLIAQPLEYPLGGVTLLHRSMLVGCEDRIDHAQERIELRPRRRLGPPISGRRRERAHLPDRSRVLAEPRRRLALRQSLDEHRTAHNLVADHLVHPQPLEPPKRSKGLMARYFYSAREVQNAPA